MLLHSKTINHRDDNMKTIASLLIAIVLVAGCAVHKGMDEQLQEAHYEAHANSTTKESFEKQIPNLDNIVKGTLVLKSGIDWDVHELKSRNKLVGVTVKLNGWFKSLSGGLRGYLSGLGFPVGLEGNKIIGRHVFGYSWGMSLEPRYIVETEATLISKSEYDKLKSSKGSEKFSLDGDTFYFKNAVIRGVHKINAKDYDPASIEVGEAVQIKDMAAKTISQASLSRVTKYEG